MTSASELMYNKDPDDSVDVWIVCRRRGFERIHTAMCMFSHSTRLLEGNEENVEEGDGMRGKKSKATKRDQLKAALPREGRRR